MLLKNKRTNLINKVMGIDDVDGRWRVKNIEGYYYEYDSLEEVMEDWEDV